MSDFDRALRNAAQDPERPAVEFYQVSTAYSEAVNNPRSQLRMLVSELQRPMLTPDEFYSDTLKTWSPFGALMPKDQYVSAAIEATWYDHLQPEYKAYPAIIAALAATRIEIGCEHLRMPFPAFAVRLPVDFMKEEGGPPLRCMLVAMLKNDRDGSKPVTSIASEPAMNARLIPFAWVPGDEEADHVLTIQVKYIDRDGDDAFAHFSIALREGVTLEDELARWVEIISVHGAPVRARAAAAGGYLVSPKMARELLALAVGISFFATGRHKAERPILQRDPRPRPERRRFEKEHGGAEQPTFAVGRELILPREEGAPAPDTTAGVGEGSGRSLKWGHYRTGHLRFQAHGPGMSERRLIFIEPTLVRPDLPLRPRVTPGEITGDRPARDITEP